MARNAEDNNIIPFGDARRSGRVSSRNVRDPESSKNTTERSHDPFARASKVSRSGRVTPLRSGHDAQRASDHAAPGRASDRLSDRAAARAARSGEIAASKKRSDQIFAPEEYDEGSYAVTTRRAAGGSSRARSAAGNRAHAPAASAHSHEHSHGRGHGHEAQNSGRLSAGTKGEHQGSARHGVADAQVTSRPPRASSGRAGAPASRFAIDERDLASLLGDDAPHAARKSRSTRADRSRTARDRGAHTHEAAERETVVREERDHESEAVVPRAAIEVFDERDLQDEDETGSAKANRKKKHKAKAKAEKMFTRQFGSDAGAPSEAGSRAALYKGEMGRAHKRAFSHLLDGALSHMPHGAGQSGRTRSREEKAPAVPPQLAIAGVVTACLIGGVAFLYPPAKQFYHETRTQARLQAEYDALQERNNSIQSSIDHLSTDEGIKDEAREQLGWVEKGETAVHVEGLPEDAVKEKKEAVYAQVANGSIPTPATWYSAVLDPIFGYVDPTSVSGSFDGEDASNISDKPSAEGSSEEEPAS